MAFTQLLNSTGTNYLSQEESKELWNHCQKQGFIDKEGDFTENFKPDHFGFSLNLPDNFINMDEAIINRIKKFLPREFVKDARNRQKIRYNKRIELNPDFKILWDKISQKTQYSIEFRTEDLINLVIKKIKEIPEIKQTQIEISKRDLKITESGIEGDKITSNQIYLIDNKQPLPDILKFLQRETELTRGTLTKILQKSGRLKEFAINPAIFMTEITKKIKEALNELIIDGIKYEPLAGHFYEMRLFEEEEIEAYLDKIYSISSRDNRTPYDYIAYDSSIEKDFAEKLDNDEKIKFFCKLPRWFKINTPIGDYNPDWAIVTQNNEKKLYLVRETKSTDDSNQRRYKENKKLECGKAHFKALDINFKTATSVYDILQE